MNIRPSVSSRASKRRPSRIKRMFRDIVESPAKQVGAVVALGVSVVAVFALFQEIAGQKPSGNSHANGGLGIFSLNKPPKHQFADKQLYVIPNNNAVQQAAEWRESRAEDASQMDKLAVLPGALWVGDQEDFGALGVHFAEARRSNKVALTVLYNIPGRDCGLYSAGGADTDEQYRAFVDAFAASIADTPTIVVIEPDAVAQLTEYQIYNKDCLDSGQQQARLDLLKYAVTRLNSLPETAVYLDAGNSAWVADTGRLTENLKSAGIADADGFALNVSNFRTNEETIAYGETLSDRLDEAHFVIDTSRNGLGHYINDKQPEFGWCNPPGRAIGHHPTLTTDHRLVDAYLHIKNVGESDGQDPDPDKCFGGPRAGEWSPEYALGLIQRWPPDLQP